MTYDQWFSQYLTLYKRDLKPRTRQEYDRLHAQLIAPMVGALELAELTPEHLQALLNAAAAHGGRTAAACYDLIRAVLRRAVRSRLLLWSPLEAIDRPRHQPAPGRALSDEDYAAAVEIADDDLGIALALYAGLRRGEILGLRWQDIDLPAGVLHVRRQYDGHKAASLKSASGLRDLPIAPPLARILRANWRFGRSYCVPLSPSALDRRWRRAQEDAGVAEPYRLHDLRHTYATRLLMAGCSLKIVQYLMGHASMDITARTYIHVTAADAAREVARVYAAQQ